MMRFYGLSDRDVLEMPFARLLLLYSKIDELEAGEDIRAILVTHAGDPKSSVRNLQERIDGRSTQTIQSGPTVDYLIRDPASRDFMSTIDPGVIATIRARQQAADEALRAERERASYRM